MTSHVSMHHVVHILHKVITQVLLEVGGSFLFLFSSSRSPRLDTLNKKRKFQAETSCSACLAVQIIVVFTGVLRLMTVFEWLHPV